MYLSALMVSSQKCELCKLPMPWATHPIPSQLLAFEICIEKKPDVTFPLWPGGHILRDFHIQY